MNIISFSIVFQFGGARKKFCPLGGAWQKIIENHCPKWLTAGPPLHANKELPLANRKKKKYYQANYHMTWWVISADVAATLEEKAGGNSLTFVLFLLTQHRNKELLRQQWYGDKQLPENICRNPQYYASYTVFVSIHQNHECWLEGNHKATVQGAHTGPWMRDCGLQETILLNRL